VLSKCVNVPVMLEIHVLPYACFPINFIANLILVIGTYLIFCSWAMFVAGLYHGMTPNSALWQLLGKVDLNQNVT